MTIANKQQLGRLAAVLTLTGSFVSAAAFVSPPQAVLSPIPRSFVSAIARQSTSTEQTAPLTSAPPTNDEQVRLLRKVVETRRLKAVEAQELAASRTKSATKLSLSQASGYGGDLEAYDEALDAGHKAREALITRNMPLVRYCVKDIVGTPERKKRPLQSLSYDDLVQEGAIGLSRAVDRWDPAIGGKFSTYAVYWIRAAVLRGIAERDDLVRVPVHMSSAVNRLTAAAKQLGIELDGDQFLNAVGHNGGWDEAQAAKQLAEKAGLSKAQLERAVQVKRRRSRGGIRSFETWMQQGKDLESDHVVSGSQSSSRLDLDHLRSELGKFLRPKEVEALSWRYGLTSDGGEQSKAAESKRPATQGKWGEAMSFVEVGKRMQVSAEYGRRLCQKALSKLRLAHEQGHLEPSLLAL